MTLKSQFCILVAVIGLSLAGRAQGNELDPKDIKTETVDTTVSVKKTEYLARQLTKAA